MNQPRITVVTPSLNRGRFLERAICSVLDQGYKNLEYFVIDGGSTDDSVDTIRLYERDLAGWVSEPDLGRAHAINKGLERATGEIVAFLNSDDLYLPGTLSEIVRRMTADDQPQWVVGQYTWISPSDQMRGPQLTSAPRSFASHLMHDSGNLPGATSFWRRRCFQTHGLFDQAMQFGFDYEYGCRLLAAGHWPTMVPRTLVARREHTDNRRASDTVQMGVEYLIAAGRYASTLSLADRYALWVNCDTRRRIYALAQAEIYNGSGRRYLCQQLWRRPWWITNVAVRHAILHGIDHPLPRQDTVRPAA